MFFCASTNEIIMQEVWWLNLLLFFVYIIRREIQHIGLSRKKKNFRFSYLRFSIDRFLYYRNPWWKNKTNTILRTYHPTFKKKKLHCWVNFLFLLIIFFDNFSVDWKNRQVFNQWIFLPSDIKFFLSLFVFFLIVVRLIFFQQVLVDFLFHFIFFVLIYFVSLDYLRFL